MRSEASEVVDAKQSRSDRRLVLLSQPRHFNPIWIVIPLAWYAAYSLTQDWSVALAIGLFVRAVHWLTHVPRSNAMKPIAIEEGDLRHRALSAARYLRWEVQCKQRRWARFFVHDHSVLGNKVITVVYFRRYLLVNVRNCARLEGMVWPLSRMARDRVIRHLELALDETAPDSD